MTPIWPARLALGNATYFAELIGRARASSLDSENPAQGLTIDHASTQRTR